MYPWKALNYINANACNIDNVTGVLLLIWNYCKGLAVVILIYEGTDSTNYDYDNYNGDNYDSDDYVDDGLSKGSNLENDYIRIGIFSLL